MFNTLIRSKEFWAALILFVAALANWLIPNIPKEVVSAFLGLLGVVAAVLTVVNVKAQLKSKS